MTKPNLISKDTAAWSLTQEKFFDELSEAVGNYDFGKESSDSRRLAEKFFRIMELEPQTSIMELGCGRGEWLLRFLKAGYLIDGTDISTKALVLIQKEAGNSGLESKLQLFKIDVQDEQLPAVISKTYDRVFCHNLLHHVLDIEGVVRNMAALTKPGGMVVAYEPNPWHFWWHICRFFDNKFKWEVEKGLLRTKPAYIKNLFLRSGLTNVEVLPWDYFPFIAPKKTLYLTNRLHAVFERLPYVKDLAAVYVIRGYKR